MKKFPIIFAAVLTCFTLTACSSHPNDDAEDKTPEITENNPSDSTNNNPDISTTESTESNVSEIPEENSSLKITLSGDPNDTFNAETDCYAENDEVVLYFQKDVTIKGDMLEIATKAMNDLCETTGFNFHQNYCTDENYQYLMDMYFEPNIFDNVNSDGLKINILVVDLGDMSERADGNNAVLDPIDFDYADGCYGNLYHELAHVIHFRNGIGLCSMMNEGFATYIENKTRLDHNIPAWIAAQYYFPAKFDESLISGGEETFKCTFDDIDTNYQYGFRFITFLYETYGEDIFADILSKATENGFDESYNEDDIEASLNEDTQQLLEIIKSLTTENVMSDFNQWYNNNWERLGQEYLEQVNSIAPEIPEENSASKITLSGDPNDTFNAETDCYAENDEVILYFQKDVTIKGDMLEIATKAMNDLCETTGFNFHQNYCSDENYRYLMDMYFEPNIFDNVNSDGLKINILVVDLDDMIEAAGGNYALLAPNDFDYADGCYGTLYHELAHVIHFRNGVRLGSMMNEGFAAYIENKTRLDHNIPAWNATQYYFPAKFDESLIPGGEETFRCTFDDDDTNYQYGFKFITFLYQTYGEDIFADILSKATENGFDESNNEDTQQLLEIIKSLTTENVMSDFNKWYNNNWERLGQEYLEQVNSLE